MDLQVFLSDLRTYHIMGNNENFYNRLLEAYQAIKSAGINSKEAFMSSENSVPVGAFTYFEITIFDRIQDDNYKNLLMQGWYSIHNQTERYIEDKQIGDKLASWGKLGETPFREDLINKGLVTHGLTEEESSRHFG